MASMLQQSPAITPKVKKRRAVAFERVIGVLAIALFLLIWQMVTVAANFLYFPPPTEIFANVADRWLSGNWTTLWITEAGVSEIGPSIVRMLSGWLIAVVIGIVVGFAFGLLPQVSRYFEPMMHFIRSLPPTALIPVFLMVLGVGDSMKVTFIAATVVWPIILNTMDGVRAVDTTQLATAKIYGIKRWRVLSSIILPSALPKIFAGLTLTLSLALILMVISEMVAATNGLGFVILSSQRTFMFLDMWSGIVVLSIFGFLLNGGLTLIQHRVLRWHREARGND